MKILVIREFDDFSQILTENNFEVTNLQLIETKPLNDLSNFEDRTNYLESYNGIFLTSRQAARILTEKLNEKGLHYSGKIYVLGKKSLDILKTENLNVFYDESANTAQELLEKIPAYELKGKNFLVIRGTNSLQIIPQFLSEFSKIDEVVVYETRKVAPEIDKITSIRRDLEKRGIAAICFFSPSGAENFFEIFKQDEIQGIDISVIGKTTAKFFEKQNLKADFISPKSNSESFAAGLIDFLKTKLN